MSGSWEGAVDLAPDIRSRLSGGDEALGDLFFEGRDVAAEDVVAAGEIVDAGLARRLGDRLHPLVEIDVWEDRFVAHDPAAPDRIGPETVLGVNNTTRTIGALIPQRPVDRALDLATGPGSLALRIAHRAGTVVATDLSPRACGYAEFNAALNGVDLDVRPGDLFEPVAGDDPFDLVVGNLPFVVGPDTAFRFRDGGREGDLISREAVEGVGGHLSPDGIAVLMCNWIVPAGVDAAGLPLEWLAGEEGSALVLHHSTESPGDYSRRWNAFLLGRDPSGFAETVARWDRAFSDWGVEGIANGIVVVRADGGGHRATFTLQRSPAGDGAAQVLRILDQVSWLAGDGGDDALLRARPALVSPHRLEQVMRYDDGWTAGAASMVLDDTAGVVGEVEPLATHVVLRFDGRTPVSDLVAAAAVETGIDDDVLRESSLRTLRGLVETGCVGLR